MLKRLIIEGAVVILLFLNAYIGHEEGTCISKGKGQTLFKSSCPALEEKKRERTWMESLHEMGSSERHQNCEYASVDIVLCLCVWFLITSSPTWKWCLILNRSAITRLFLLAALLFWVLDMALD